MEDLAYSYMNWPRIEAVIYAEEQSPKDVMAPRLTSDGILIQGFFPQAEEVCVKTGRKIYPMVKEDESGYFAVMIPGKKIPSYRFQVRNGEETKEFEDAYAFPCLITEAEERAFCAGVYYDAYTSLGSHTMTLEGVEGTYFAVWAPNAMRVSIVGDFTGWDGRMLPMHRMPMSGIFELFVPGIKEDTPYMYEIRTKSEGVFRKADPYGRSSLLTKAGEKYSLISLTSGEDDFDWEDREWLLQRHCFALRDQPVSILELKLTQWEDMDSIVRYASDTGYTHVELLPVMECLDPDSDGYSTAAYFSVAQRVGGARKLKELINALHKAGTGVILDWCAAQFPRFPEGLERFDGTMLYEIPDPSANVHPFWGTMLYNYDSPMVKDFLISNACYWLNEFHVDGLRLDDVDAMLYLDYGRQNGSWKPNYYGSNENLHAVEFIKHLNSVLHRMQPGVLMIAQEDGLWPELTDQVENDHPGFDYKWSGGWTRDFLSYMTMDPLMRSGGHDQLTLSMLYAYCEHYILTLGRRDIGSFSSFLDHLPGSISQKHSQLRQALAYMYVHPGCKETVALLPDEEGSEAELCFLADLNKLYREHPALYALDSSPEGFEWIQLTKNRENVLVFLRKTANPEEDLLVAANFSGLNYGDYRIGVPYAGEYREIFNTDALQYGGTGFVNPDPVRAMEKECDERRYSIFVNLASLSVAVFSCS